MSGMIRLSCEKSTLGIRTNQGEQSQAAPASRRDGGADWASNGDHAGLVE